MPGGVFGAEKGQPHSGGLPERFLTHLSFEALPPCLSPACGEKIVSRS